MLAFMNPDAFPKSGFWGSENLGWEMLDGVAISTFQSVGVVVYSQLTFWSESIATLSLSLSVCLYGCLNVFPDSE